MHLYKAVCGDDCQGRFVVLEMGISDVQLGLLSIATVRKTTLHFLVSRDRSWPIAGGQLGLPHRDELLRGPVGGFIFFLQDRAATGEQWSD